MYKHSVTWTAGNIHTLEPIRCTKNYQPESKDSYPFDEQGKPWTPSEEGEIRTAYLSVQAVPCKPPLQLGYAAWTVRVSLTAVHSQRVVSGAVVVFEELWHKLPAQH